MTIQFQVGKTYTCRSICDHECIFSFKITRRTAKTVWIKSSDGKVKSRRVRVCQYDNCETIDPHGVYSMSPVLHATGMAR